MNPDNRRASARLTARGGGLLLELFTGDQQGRWARPLVTIAGLSAVFQRGGEAFGCRGSIANVKVAADTVAEMGRIASAKQGTVAALALAGVLGQLAQLPRC